MEDWYNELFSNANGSDFNKHEIPDHFSVSVHDGNTLLSEWDITQDLLDDGMKWINYTNSSLNVSLEFAFLHRDIVERFRDEEYLKKMIERALNDTMRYGNLSGHIESVEHSYERNFLPQMYYSQGALTVFLGAVGLFVKLREKSQARVVKVTRISYSICSIFAGILLILSEFTRNVIFAKSNHFDELKVIYILLHGAAKTLLRALVVSLKIFTVFVYGFQNLMVFRPFYFREHKKALNKWFLRLSFFQSAGFFVGLTVWAAILVFVIDHLNCIEFNRYADDLKLVMTVFAGTGYTISLILSLSFAVGFYRKNTKDLGRKDNNNIKKTMIACTVEILFDIALPIGLSFASFKCFSAALYTASIHFNEVLASVDIECGIRVRLEALDGGMSRCILVFLLLQPVVQELVFFISLLVDYCRNDSS